MSEFRTPSYPIDPLFHRRWSPRAFDRAPVTKEELDSLFEAARWAPSAFNVQPWRFLYALRGAPDWERYLSLLIEFNAAWVRDAGGLIFVLSDTLMPGKPHQLPLPSHSHSFDAGAAWAQLALQASQMGLATHGMTGLQFHKVRDELAIPDRFRVEAAIAVGRRADPESLPVELRAREQPSDRKPIAQFTAAGTFPSNWA